MSVLSSKLLTGSVLAVIGLITVKILMGVLGAVTGFVSFVLFTLLPILLIGWLVLKVVKHLTRDKNTVTE